MTYAGDERTPADLTHIAPDNIGHDATPHASIAKPKKPLPTCIMSGEALDKDRMIRLVIGPDGVLYPDFAEKLPGRAFWCNLYRPVFEQALHDNPFGATIPDDMMDRVEKGLRTLALGLISMARKAGHLYTGAEKTEQLVRDGHAAIYLTASPRDGDTRMKITFLAGEKCRIVDLFTSDELSTASGMNKVFHAAMMHGGTSKQFFVHVKRLNLFLNPSNKKAD